MRRSLRVRGGRVVVEDRPGPVDAGARDPLVLLHGFTGSRSSWEGIVDALAAERRVIALDLPGHGETSLDDHSLATTIRGLFDALDVLGLVRFVLAGYSMGGRVALAAALAAPERVGRLVLESASPGLASPEERRDRRESDEALARAIENGGVARFVDSWERRPLFAGVAKLPAPERARLREIRLANRAEGLSASLRGLGVGSQPWLGDRLGELAMPVLVVAGDEDTKFATIARAMAGAIPVARLALFPRAGHVPHLEDREAFLRALRSFLFEEPPSDGAGAKSPQPDEENECSTGRP